MAASHYRTPEMLRALPGDGKRYETVHGELLVTPAPIHRHQFITAEPWQIRLVRLFR